MKYKESPLLFHEFVIVDSHLETVFDSQNNKCDLSKIMLDIDFETFIMNEKKSIFNVAVNISGNENEPVLPGYKFSIIGNGIFELTNAAQLEKKDIDFVLLNSALPMVISSLRNFLLNLTSYAPHGKYLLPAIDLPSLIKEKVNSDK